MQKGQTISDASTNELASK
uniref:Uncharacterized protein n=1 Tax=Arundo donax TaxID=35708 RepID=A0A0A8ZA02_ARUDO